MVAYQQARFAQAKLHNPPRERRLVDDSTLSVLWADKICPLYHTVLFRLVERQARRPNQSVTAGQLLRDVREGGVKSSMMIPIADARGRNHVNVAHDLGTGVEHVVARLRRIVRVLSGR
jgi:hypothetical protein